MLSVGIRGGEGFDQETLRKLVENRGKTYEYDILILGSNAGGMACAREARKCGKKVALVFWRIPTPAEEEGHYPDLAEISEALQLDQIAIKERAYRILQMENKTDLMNAVKLTPHKTSKVSQVELRVKSEFPFKHPRWSRKVRRNKIDIKNAIANMAVEGARYMHDMAVVEDLESQKKYGKKLPRMSWGRMMEIVQDYIIERNWTIMTDFVRDRINVYYGCPVFIDDHTVRVCRRSGREKEIGAEVVIAALEVHNTFPQDVIGARDFGINYDDFFRLDHSPGRTLIVGANAPALECAGILATFKFPVVVVYRSSILKECDNEITNMIVDDLTKRGVEFIGPRNLLAIRKNQQGDKLVAEFDFEMDEGAPMDDETNSYDTVLFTSKEKIIGEDNPLKMESERLTGKVYTLDEEFFFHNIRMIPDYPGNVAATELSGKMMGASLGCVEEDTSSNLIIPNAILTPLEYAYIGASENFGRKRLGKNCIETFSGNFDAGELFEKGEIPLKDNNCYVKVITVRNRNIVVGVHVLGRDSVRVIGKMVGKLSEKMIVENLPQVVRDLKETSEYGEEFDREPSDISEMF